MRPERVAAQEQRQTAAGHDGRKKSFLLEPESLQPERLRGKTRSVREDHLQRLQREIAQQHPDCEQRGEEDDLEDARVPT